MLGQVVVMGLRDDVTEVYLGSEVFAGSYSQDPVTNTVSKINLGSLSNVNTMKRK